MSGGRLGTPRSGRHVTPRDELQPEAMAAQAMWPSVSRLCYVDDHFLPSCWLSRTVQINMSPASISVCTPPHPFKILASPGGQ